MLPSLTYLALHPASMPLRRQAVSLLQAALAGLLVVHLLCVMALAAMPEWHERVHAGAGQCEGEHHHEGDGHERGEHHDCAVTMFLAGACHSAVAVVEAGHPMVFAVREPVCRGLPMIVSSYRARGIFEHAPPSRA